MKKVLALISAVIMLLGTFTACSDSDGQQPAEQTAVYEWPQAAWFRDVPKYKSGHITYSDINTASTVRIDESSFDEYKKYIGKLKSKGFAFHPTQGMTDEKLLLMADGTCTWTGSNGSIYMLITYVSADSSQYGKYGCNVSIQTYSVKPSLWK